VVRAFGRGRCAHPRASFPPYETNYPSITKFQQLVELKDYRPPTKKEYVRYVRKLAEHFQCDPATLTEDQLRQYFLFLREHKRYSRSPMKMAKYALLCFYVQCLKVRGWTGVPGSARGRTPGPACRALPPGGQSAAGRGA